MQKVQITRSERQARRNIILICAVILVPVCLLLSVVLGAVNIPLKSVFLALTGSGGELQDSLIIQKIRMPRALLAAVVGAMLALCGAATQGLFRNPLADPSLIGVTAGASAGGSVVIVLGAGGLASVYALSLISAGAFLGGVLSVWLVYRFSTNAYGTSVATMLLAGIALTAVAGSLINMFEFFSDDSLLRQISLWRMGGLEGADYPRVLVACLVAVPIFFLLPRKSKALNAMLLGESEARHLGINVNKVKTHLIAMVAMGVGVSVALAGTIAFVGLIVPHMVRLLIGPDHKYLLPGSALAGAILLLASDIIARLAIAPTELPVGLVTALIGAPVFVSLLRRRHVYGMN